MPNTRIPTGLTGVVLAIATSAGCSTGSPAANAPLGATCDQFSASPAIQQSVHLAVGATAVVELCANPTTGYAWGDPTVADPGVAQIVSNAYRESGAASPPVVGAAGREVVTIRALAEGATSIDLSYGQPWAGGQNTWTYRLGVAVP